MLILYDGQCFLCNSFIRRIFKRDQNDILRAASLQDFRKIRDFDLADRASEMESVLLLDQAGNISSKSTAALRILITISKVRFFYKLLLLVPSFFRDLFYDLVAKYRYRIWGKSESCILPTPEYRKKYLLSQSEVEEFLLEMNIKL